MVRNRESILGILQDDGPILRRLGVRRLALFGSAARDELSPGSDLDFLVELNAKTFDAYMTVKEHLEDRFACRVDLVLRSALKPELRDQILAEALDAPLT